MDKFLSYSFCSTNYLLFVLTDLVVFCLYHCNMDGLDVDNGHIKLIHISLVFYKLNSLEIQLKTCWIQEFLVHVYYKFHRAIFFCYHKLYWFLEIYLLQIKQFFVFKFILGVCLGFGCFTSDWGNIDVLHFGHIKKLQILSIFSMSSLLRSKHFPW